MTLWITIKEFVLKLTRKILIKENLSFELC